MIHLPQLIIDLALILGVAAVTTLLFKWLKQPVVLGYIVAGMLVGPNFSVFPTIADSASIAIWAEIGVIFLLFSLGLEFSFKKLVKVGGSASITAVIEVTAMLGIGFVTGQLLGWTLMDSLFLGGILSISSTTIIIRAFEELGVKNQKFAGIVFGALIVEDLVAILLLVLLSTLAVSQQFEGVQMMESVLKLGFFLAIWFLAGIFILPTFLRRAKRLMNEETLLVISVALCLLMVILATKAGFSPALGAFIMGSILAETLYAEKIEHLIKSVKDLFASVFFVSVGMLINPVLLAEYAWPILVITLATILGKSISSAIGALLSGQPLKQSVQTGMSLAQIGEFSFIIASLGLSLKVTSDFLYPIAVAVSALTTFTTPYLIGASERTYNWIESKLPKRWIGFINSYSANAQTISSVSEWRGYLRSYVKAVVLNSVVVVSIILLSTTYLAPFVENKIVKPPLGSLLAGFLALLAMAPFLWALAIRRPKNEIFSKLWERRFFRGPLVFMELGRIIVAFLLIGTLVNQFSPGSYVLIGTIFLVICLMAFFTARLEKYYYLIEKRFLLNLNSRELESYPVKGRDLLPWDAHIANFQVNPDADCIGKSLEELAFRERFGVNVAAIERGNQTIRIPKGADLVYPYDKITVIGTDSQLEQFRKAVEAMSTAHANADTGGEIALEQIMVQSNFPFLGISIRNSGIRESTMGMVVGLERDHQRFLNPNPETVFAIGDRVWIAGNLELIKKLKRT